MESKKEFMNIMENTEQKKIFLTSLALAAAFEGLAFVVRAAHIPVPPCVFFGLTGLYCPGCGGTRSLIALLHGQFLRSLIYHPVVPYGAAVYFVYVYRNLLALLSIAAKRPGDSRRARLLNAAAGKWPLKCARGMAFHNGYLYGAVAVILANWAVKNALLCVFHLSM